MWRLTELLSDWIKAPSEAMLLTDVRPLLDDRAFFERFYQSSNVPEYLPIYLRALLTNRHGRRWLKVWPGDKLRDLDDELDIVELLFEVEDDFQISIPLERVSRLDGSFDSVVKCIAEVIARSEGG